jgi:hypothetical protein
LATRLATSGAVIAALEAGDERGLPPWPETVRVVTSFLGLAGIDARPVLRAIEAQQQRLPVRPAAPLIRPAPAAPRGHLPPGRALVPVSAAPLPARVAAAPAAVAATEPEPPGLVARLGAAVARLRPSGRDLIGKARGVLAERTVRRSLAGLGAAAMLALLAWTSMLQAAVVTLAPPLAGVVRHVHEFIVVQMAPEREGLRWIEVADPRSRRGDKLQIARR